MRKKVLKDECRRPTAQLRAGGRFKLIHVGQEANGEYHIRKKAKGTVIQTYPHIFVAQMDGHSYYECFSNNLLQATYGLMIKPM